MRMFGRNSFPFLSLDVGGGGLVLDFHHCAALGLNKVIVRPGPEGIQ